MKYKIGDKVWAMVRNRPEEIEITGCLKDRMGVSYTDWKPVNNTSYAVQPEPRFYYTESDMFDTKEELIASL